MTPNRPYLLRALFDWICDNNATPYLLVDATLEGVEVPFEHVNGGRIVLNASGSAVANFDITDEAVSFNTRFSGRDTWIHVPMAAVLAIYARETQEGMTFAPSDYPDRKQRPEYSGAAEQADSATSASSRASSSASAGAIAPTEPADSSDRSDTSDTSATSDNKSKKAGNHLKVIK